MGPSINYLHICTYSFLHVEGSGNAMKAPHSPTRPLVSLRLPLDAQKAPILNFEILKTTSNHMSYFESYFQIIFFWGAIPSGLDFFSKCGIKSLYMADFNPQKNTFAHQVYGCFFQKATTPGNLMLGYLMCIG